MCLLGRHIAQLVRQGKTVKIAKSILSKIIACKDIIFNKQFRAPLIYRQALIFVDKFCWFSFTRYKQEFLKIFAKKIWFEGTVIEIAVQQIFHVNGNFPWKRPIISMNYFERVLQEFWPQIKKHILCRTYVLQSSHFWTKLPLAAYWISFSRGLYALDC